MVDGVRRTRAVATVLMPLAGIMVIVRVPLVPVSGMEGSERKTSADDFDRS